jgi:hypothetical protein
MAAVGNQSCNKVGARRSPPLCEERLTADIVELARRHGGLGYREIAEMLRSTDGYRY